MSDYDVMIKIAGQLEGSFKNAIKGAQSGLTGLGLSGKVGGMALKGIGLAAKATAAGLAAAGAGIAAVGAYSMNVGKEFEAQMSTVASISGATGDELQALQDKARQMGATTSFSATEAGQAMEYMAMAGWKTGEMVDGIGGIMNLAAASGEDLALTSDIVTDALTAFGLSASDSGHFADVLAAASSNANTNVAMLGESFQYAAPVAGALGISAEDTSVALGLMANAGIKASSAGTALRTGLTNLSKPTKQMKQYMDKYNISMIENADGSINLRDTMKDLRSKMSGLSETEQAAAASAIFGKNSMAGWLAIVNSSDKDFDKLTGAIDGCKGAAEEMAAVKLDNLEGDITLLKSAAEAFGISVYENMNKPLRSVAQYGKSQLEILQNALDSGGFEGLTKAIGGVLSDAVTKIAEAAPDFIDGAADLVESLLDGIDSNSDKLGDSIGRLITTLGAAVVRLAPRLAVTGVHLLLAIGKGIISHLDVLKDSAMDAVEYLMNAIKDGFSSFKDFLGDDSVEPFKKVLALLPLLAGGFVIFDSIGGAVKGFVSSFKGAGKAMPKAAKGFTSAGNQMSKVAKNILAVGAGIALAAGGVFLLVKAAEEISAAGPGAVAALVIMAGGLTALMAVASVLGPKLDAAKGGLLAFGGAILMAAGGMALMSFAAVQLAQAGPLAMVGIGIMVGGMIALMAVAGAMGTQLAAAAPGLLAFGGAILMASAGMAIMAASAIALSNAGMGAMVMFGVLAVAVGAFMAIAAALGPTLVVAGAGMLLLGAGLLLAAAAMALLANTAIMLSSAGTGAIVTMALLAAGILVFGAAAGALAPLLMAGGAALAVFGAGLAVVSAAAILAGVGLMIISASLPTIATYGTTAAAGIVALGAGMTVLGAGATVAGGGLLIAAAGLAALAVSGLLAMVPMVAIGAAFVGIGAATAILASSGQTAADSLDRLTDHGLGAMASMTALAAAVAVPVAPLTGLAAAFVATTAGAAAFAVSVGASGAAVLVLTAGLLSARVALMGINMAIMAFRTQAVILGTATNIAGQAFVQFGTMVAPVSARLMALVAPMTAAGAAAVAMAAGMGSAVASTAALAAAMTALAVSAVASAAGFSRFNALIGNAMAQANMVVRTSMTQMRTSVQTGVTQMTLVVTSGMTLMVAAFRSGGVQLIAISNSTASGIRAAFNIDLSSAGRNMMQGLINGMESMRAQIAATARSIATEAANAVNSALQIHSPSRLLEQSGQYTGAGLALGMEESVPGVRSAALDMTEPMRSSAITETANGGGSTVNNNSQSESATFSFSPTYVIQGNADKEVMQEAAQTSRADFEQWFDELMRERGRAAW